MGARCERIVGVAFDGIEQKAPRLVDEVSALDTQIDRDELDVHALILRILALRQPVADDLRFLATALRLITDLERVGDEAVNIAERAMEADVGERILVAGELRIMANASRDMLHLALDAFLRGDDEQAERVLGCDDQVDSRCAAVIRAMTAWIANHPAEVRAGLRTIRVAKYLERIADHATNVAEEAIFMVRAEDVRHGQWRRASATAAVASEPTRAAGRK
jgi:phosphate transport system protein